MSDYFGGVDDINKKILEDYNEYNLKSEMNKNVEFGMEGGCGSAMADPKTIKPKVGKFTDYDRAKDFNNEVTVDFSNPNKINKTATKTV